MESTENQAAPPKVSRSPSEQVESETEDYLTVRLPAHVLRALPRIGSRSGYTPMQRYATACAWSVHGNAAEAGRNTGVAETTVAGWTHEPWWALMLDAIYAQRRREVDAALSGVIKLALAETMDRLVHGDVSINQGKITRHPVKARDAAIIAALAIEKQRLLRGQSTSKVERVNLSDLRQELGQVVEGESIQIIDKPNPNNTGESNT